MSSIVSETTTKRLIKNPDWEQFACDTCGVPATNSCTDAIEIKPSDDAVSGWTESGVRYGCDEHKTIPLVYYADGRVIPFSQCQPEQKS